MSRNNERVDGKVSQRRATEAARRQRGRALGTQRGGRSPRRVDVVALVFGVIFASMAAVGLWRAAGGSIDWGLIRILAPLGLVAVGVLGLALSRNRN